MSNLFTYLKKYSEGKGASKVNSKSKQAKESKVKEQVVEKREVDETQASHVRENNSAENLVRAGSSLDVDEIYHNIREKGDVGVISRIIFSNPVDYKEPNLGEIEKISLY